jgi:hypothetical protein
MYGIALICNFMHHSAIIAEDSSIYYNLPTNSLDFWIKFTTHGEHQILLKHHYLQSDYHYMIIITFTLLSLLLHLLLVVVWQMYAMCFVIIMFYFKISKNRKSYN